MKKLLLAALFSTFAVLPSTAQESDLQGIVDRGVIRIGAVNAPPYYSRDLATDEWTGLIPEISKAIFDTVGIEIEFVPTEWGTAVAGLQANQFDLMGAYNATPQRALAIDFTQPVGHVPTAVVTMADDPSAFDSWEKINDPSVRIAAVEGAGTTRTAQTIAPEATWVTVPSNDEMILSLESGRADIALTSQPTVQDYIEARGRGKMVIPEPMVGNPANFGLRKSASRDLRDWLDIAIAAGKDDRTITAIWESYLPSE